MPTYVYEILDKDGNSTGKQFEWYQSMSSDAFLFHPETKEPCRRAIACPNIKHNGPTWDWCESTRRYINHMKPKYIRDDKAGIRKKYPKGGV